MRSCRAERKALSSSTFPDEAMKQNQSNPMFASHAGLNGRSIHCLVPVLGGLS